MITNLAAVHTAHRRLLSQTQAAILLELADAGKFAVDYVKKHPTFKPRSGLLQARTQWIPLRGSAVRIQNTARYANAIESGSKPHLIVARRRKALRFVTNGKVVFARRVSHPGNRPFKFLYRATNAAGRILEQNLADRMKRAAAAFSSSR